VSAAFDAIIIGAGQAGPPLVGRLTQAGLRTAIIERKQFGGTCVNTGCTPTKAMVASARVAHLAKRAADFGVAIGGSVEVDMRAVKARKDTISGNSRTGLEHWLDSMEKCTVYRGHARFVSPTQVVVGDDVLTAPRIFVNVGGRAIIPDLPGLERVPYLTNSTILDMDELPRHLVIIGGSYIALEFAQMFRRFGSEVTVLERSERLLQREDEDVSAAILATLEREGVRICTNVALARLDAQPGGIRVALADPDATAIEGSHLLLAVGRRPNTDDLDLDQAGVQVDKRGYIDVDEELRTSAPGIWALGDCNGKGAFTHTSYNDFEIVAANLLEDQSRRIGDRIPAYALYTDPPLGRVGITETEARAQGRRVLVGKRPMTRVGRAVEKGETDGFMKVVVDATTQELLGAAIYGVGGDEVVHTVADAMYAKAPYTVLKNAMHIHPTVAELVPTVLGELKASA
jgi:pyruvate/2-oxoglutarate dehydrogenase complex dihydrolipoamide dehydrogenase (E3) component